MGHLLGCACEILGISKFDSEVQLPSGILRCSSTEQLKYISNIATQVVENCTPIEQANADDDVDDTNDNVYKLQG